MANDIVDESVSTAAGAYMGVVGIVQALAVGMLLEHAEFFQLLASDRITGASGEVLLAFFQATVVFQMIVLTWHMNLQNAIAFKRAFGMWDSYIPFSFVFAEYYLARNASPERFWQWEFCVLLFMVCALFAFTHVYFVARKNLARNKAVLDRVGTYPFWVRICISAMALLSIAGLLIDTRDMTPKLVLAGLLDVSLFVFMFINTRFFWTRLVSADDLRRG
jgi:hypothetical protein